MLRVALDTDNIELMGPLAPIMLTYADLVPNPDQIRARIAPSTLVLIDRKLGDPSGQASVCDIEPGAWDAAEFPAWYDRQAARGVKFLTGYADRNIMPAVDTAMHGRGFWRWLATLDGTLHAAGFEPLKAPALVQALNASSVGLSFDLSIVMEDQWHPTPDLTAFPVLAEIVRHARTSVNAADTDLATLLTKLGSH